MAIEVFNGTSIPRELTTAAMEFLWVKWKTLNDTNDLSLQRLTEECSYQLRSNSIHLLTINDDFVYMYVGEAVQANASESLAGTLLSQQINPLKREFADVYHQVAQAPHPRPSSALLQPGRKPASSGSALSCRSRSPMAPSSLWSIPS